MVTTQHQYQIMATKLLPGRPVPELNLSMLGADSFDIRAESIGNFLLLVVYRGLHCPICEKYLNQMQDHLDALHQQEVTAVAVSMDDEARARKTRSDWGLDKLRLAYGMTAEDAAHWGLYVSRSIKEAEPEHFAEPAMFIIKPDLNLYAGWIQSTPFARPRFDDLVDSLDFILENDYPPRGAMKV